MAVFVVVTGVGPRRALAQISPGPLAQSHASLEGPLHCTSCHAWGKKELMSARCLSCHEEIAWLVQQNRGYHSQVREQRCASCHPDHAGRDFAMISWPGGAPARFDHTKAGWALEGKHATAACQDCHTAKYRVSPAAAKSKRTGADAGWVGLETRCAACHEDVHRGALSGNCLKCHDTRAWKPTPGFDHAKTAYPLTGKHVTVACASCHVTPTTTGAKAIPVFKPVAHAECSACHRDPHTGRFGVGCARCHTTAGFRMIDQKEFAHDRTRFPLRGKHAQVDCTGCHTFANNTMTSKPFTRCDGCHTDAHAGTATLAGRAVDCSACHDENGYRPSTFTVAQHRSAKFVLEGRHQQVRCDACHQVKPAGVPVAQLGTSGVQLRPAFAHCRDCHADRHQGQLAARPDGGECSVCHQVTGWTPSVYSISDHARLQFPLEGAHRAVPCAECHRNTTQGNGGAHFVFALTSHACQDCHKTPHGNQFASDAGGDTCTRCHGVDAFKPATRFDHDRDTSFPLKGGHQAVPCARCHPVTGTGPTARIQYHGVSARCENCHGDKTGVKPS